MRTALAPQRSVDAFRREAIAHAAGKELAQVRTEHPHDAGSDEMGPPYQQRDRCQQVQEMFHGSGQLYARAPVPRVARRLRLRLAHAAQLVFGAPARVDITCVARKSA